MWNIFVVELYISDIFGSITSVDIFDFSINISKYFTNCFKIALRGDVVETLRKSLFSPQSEGAEVVNLEDDMERRIDMSRENVAGTRVQSVQGLCIRRRESMGQTGLGGIRDRI